MAQYVPCQSCSQVVNRFLEVCPYCGEDPGGDRSDLPFALADSITPAPARYQAVDSVALFVQLLLGLFVAASIVQILTAVSYRADVLDVAAGVPVADGDLIGTENRYNAASLMGAVAYVVTSISFVVWFWRAYSNLTYFGRPRMRRPGWAIGAWFIPIAGMIIPYGIGAEIWTQSRPQLEPVAERRDPNMEPVISWWALFLIMSVVNVVGSFMLPEDYTASDLAAFVGVDIVASVVAVAAAVAAIRFVRSATDRQHQLYTLTQSRSGV